MKAKLAAPPSMFRRRGRDGFLLLEIVLAVAIFTLGVLALGRCLTNCLDTQSMLAQEDRARVALDNAMVEVQAKPSLPDDQTSKALTGMFSGITLLQSRRTLNLENEKKMGMPDLHEITITARWKAPNGTLQSRSISFDLLRARG